MHRETNCGMTCPIHTAGLALSSIQWPDLSGNVEKSFKNPPPVTNANCVNYGPVFLTPPLPHPPATTPAITALAMTLVLTWPAVC